MRGPLPTAPRGPAAQRPGRPIAAGLQLGKAHTAKINESHARCAALGVSRIERPDFSPLGRSDLAVVRERNLRLYDHAAPVMDMLYGQIVDSQNMVVLTDVTGTIIHAIGDDDFLGRATKVALAPGANWSESAKGTNAVGTALMSEQPTLVHADDHYVYANQFLTCSAAPILDPRGNILGVLDVSGDHRSYHQHTMALVKMSARMIENHWLTDDYRHVMRLHFHSRVGFIGTLMEGILAVSADGSLVGANRGALEQLGLSGAALRMHSLGSLFGTTVAALVDRFRSPLARPVPVTSHNGQRLHIHARFNWPVLTSLAEAVDQAPPSPPWAADGADASDADADAGAGADLQPGVPGVPGKVGPPPEPPGQALAALDTGDAQMARVLDKLQRVQDHDITVLILGEGGTGKARLARAIHRDSRRAGQPFVVLNCAPGAGAQPEAELFGQGPGGAPGKLAQANGGTLFLDEIGELPLALQSHLLRVLQDRQFTPPGSTRAIALDLALVCATRHKPREMVQTGQVREDLFYRLNGLAVRLPPLRERSDLAALVQRMLERQAGGSAHRHCPPQPSAELMALFAAHDWPGNLRQLSNVLRAASAVAAGLPQISRAHLPDDFLDELAALPPGAAPLAERRSLQEQEIDAIRQAVAQADGNISEAAKRLGISRNTIYRKLRGADPR